MIGIGRGRHVITNRQTNQNAFSSVFVWRKRNFLSGNPLWLPLILRQNTVWSTRLGRLANRVCLVADTTQLNSEPGSLGRLPVHAFCRFVCVVRPFSVRTYVQFSSSLSCRLSFDVRRLETTDESGRRRRRRVIIFLRTPITTNWLRLFRRSAEQNSVEIC